MAELALPELAAELADIGQKEAKINHQRAEEKGAANKSHAHIALSPEGHAHVPSCAQSHTHVLSIHVTAPPRMQFREFHACSTKP
eukprot:scaffold185108_cov19-Tisochrysis_lutea.AAC.1